jgi:pSer/pThr/pTyr-binding forkhead associated (FHA) protein
MATTYRVESGGKSAVLGSTEFVIGRSLYCTLVVDDPSVSRLHASFRRAADGCEVLDLGSSNGTFVNGVKIGDKPFAIWPSDTIVIGSLPVRLVEAIEGARERMNTSPHPLYSPDDQPTASYRDGVPGPARRPGGST